MKKTFTLLSAAALAISASAAAGHPDHNRQILKSDAPTSVEIQGKTLRIENAPAAERKSPASKAGIVTPVITEAAGETVCYNKACGGFFNMWGNLYTYNEEALAAQIVYGEGNEVYFYDIISMEAMDAYVKGTIEGNKITLPLPQTVYWVESEGYGLNLSVVNYTVNWMAGSVTASADTETDSITFTVADDGSITMEDLGETKMLGLVWNDDGKWLGDGDTFQVYNPFGTRMNAVPESVKLDTYAFMQGDFASPVDVAIDGDRLYIKGLAYDKPECVLIAEYADGEATISQNQLLGVYNSRFLISKCAYENPDLDPEDEESPWFIFADEDAVFRMKVDVADKVITCPEPEMYIVYNYSGIDYVDGLTAISDFTLKYQDSFDGTPRNPYGLMYNEEYLASRGYSSFFFRIPNVSTEGEMMLPENVYYRIFVDGDLAEFQADPDLYEYSGIPVGEVWTEIPFSFINYDEFYSWDLTLREVGIYAEGFDTLGVQTLNKCDGKTIVSDIITLDLETGEVSAETGVGAISADGDATYYDLSGRRIDNPAKGVYIVRSADKAFKVVVR